MTPGPSSSSGRSWHRTLGTTSWPWTRARWWGTRAPSCSHPMATCRRSGSLRAPGKRHRQPAACRAPRRGRPARCTHVMLEVRADNSAALRLYERFGFERISVRRRYYPDGADACIMRSVLARARRAGRSGRRRHMARWPACLTSTCFPRRSSSASRRPATRPGSASSAGTRCSPTRWHQRRRARALRRRRA